VNVTTALDLTLNNSLDHLALLSDVDGLDELILVSLSLFVFIL
jgi:hypothetical protein